MTHQLYDIIQENDPITTNKAYEKAAICISVFAESLGIDVIHLVKLSSEPVMSNIYDALNALAYMAMHDTSYGDLIGWDARQPEDIKEFLEAATS